MAKRAKQHTPKLDAYLATAWAGVLAPTPFPFSVLPDGKPIPKT